METTKKSFVKRLFNRYTNPFLSLGARFGEEKSNELLISNIRATELGIFAGLDFLKTRVFRRIDTLHESLDALLTDFTLESVSDEEIDEKIELTKSLQPRIKNIRREDRKRIWIEVDDREIYMKTLTHYLVSETGPALEHYFPDIYKKERAGFCHSTARKLSMLVSGKAEVVTGSTWTQFRGAKYLHSWVETEFDGEIWCLHPTYNWAMKKDDYYWLENVEVFDRISDEDIMKDAKLFDHMYNLSEWHMKLYLTSREEWKNKYGLLAQVAGEIEEFEDEDQK